MTNRNSEKSPASNHLRSGDSPEPAATTGSLKIPSSQTAIPPKAERLRAEAPSTACSKTTSESSPFLARSSSNKPSTSARGCCSPRFDRTPRAHRDCRADWARLPVASLGDLAVHRSRAHVECMELTSKPALLVLGTLLSACIGFGPDVIEEVHGTEVFEDQDVAHGEHGQFLALAWLQSGLIVYSARTLYGALGVRSVYVDGRLGSSPDGEVYASGLRVSDDGRVVAGVAECPKGGRALGLWDGEAKNIQLVEAGCEFNPSDDFPPGLVLGPRAAWIAFGYGRFELPTVLVHDVATGYRHRVGAGWPIAISPDGREVLIYTGASVIEDGMRREGPGPYRAVSVEDGSQRALTAPAPLERFNFLAKWAQWTDEGPQLLRFAHERQDIIAELHNLRTGDYRVLWRGSERPGPDALAWSSNGKTIAFWTRRCTESDWFNCIGPYDSRLRVIDVATGRERVKARTALETGTVAFNPAGSRLVYGIGGKLYVDEVSN